MKKLILALSLLSAGLAAAAPATAGEATNRPPALAGGEVDFKQVDMQDDLYLVEGKPFTGTTVRRHRKSGAVLARFPCREGRLHGLVEEWYTNGVQSVSTAFAAGRRDGPSTYWNPDGTVLKRQLWAGGQLKDSTHKEDLEPAPAAP